MPNTIGTAAHDGFANGVRSVTLAGVHGHGKMVLTRKVERRTVEGGRITRFAASEIESDNPRVLEGNREFRHLHRVRRWEAAQCADDDACHRAGFPLATGQPAQHGVHHVVRRQSSARVQRRTEACFDVAHTIKGSIEHKFVCNAFERRRVLHHGKRDFETREVVGEISRIIDSHPVAQLGRRADGQRNSLRDGQFVQRRRAQ